MSAKPSSIVVTGGGKPSRVLGPRARVVLLVGILVLLIAGLAAGGYALWRHNHPVKPATPKIKFVSPEVSQKAYVDTVKNATVPAGVDPSGSLQVQMGAVYSQQDYAATISYAKQLLAVPGHESDLDALQYMAKSYAALGDRTQEKANDTKIIAYLDAHPDEKSGNYGTNIYAQAQARMKK